MRIQFSPETWKKLECEFEKAHLEMRATIDPDYDMYVSLSKVHLDIDIPDIEEKLKTMGKIVDMCVATMNVSKSLLSDKVMEIRGLQLSEVQS